MSINSKKFWKRRTWLNPPKSYDDGYLVTGRDGDGEFHVKIADCGRIVDMNLWWDSKRGKTLRVKKVTNMINELEYLRDAMMEADDE